MTAPAGTEVELYVDLVAEVATGDVIETQTGRRYFVAHVRRQERGEHIGRQHLRVVVMADDSIVEGAHQVHRIRWYPRGRGKR